MTKVKVFSFCNRDNGSVRNFKRSLTKFGWDYEIVGEKEKFEGWSWRTKLYIKTLQNLMNDPNKPDIVFLVDANDLLFIQSPSAFLKKWEILSQSHKVYVSGENACCPGEFENPFKRNPFLKSYLDKDHVKNIKGINIFPNAGCIFGELKSTIDLLIKNQDAEDDQIGLTKIFHDDPNAFGIDSEQTVAASLGSGQNLPLLIRKVLQSRYFNEPDSDTFYNYSFVKNDNEVFLQWDRNKDQPILIHFPGKNFKDYNKIGKNFQGNEFEEESLQNLEQLAQQESFWTWILIVSLIVLLLVIIFIPLLVIQPWNDPK